MRHEIGNATLLTGDCLEVLRSLPDCFRANCCVTSPPYYGLRDYGTAEWHGGDESCSHKERTKEKAHASSTLGPKRDGLKPDNAAFKALESQYKHTCKICGAVRIDRQIGLEQTPDEYVARLVEVFREVRRVLADDGTLWLNLGDSYTPGGKKSGRVNNQSSTLGGGKATQAAAASVKGKFVYDTKPKDLLGIPWAVATALRNSYYAGRISRAEDRAWLAAIIDGEGTITATTHLRKDDGRIRTAANIFVTNSCDRMLQRCAEIWPGASRHEHMKPSDGHIGKRDVFRWIPTSACDKSALLRELYPHFVSKKKQALLAWNLLEFMKEGQLLGKSRIAAEVREKRERLVVLIQSLNQGGNVDLPDWAIEPPSLYEPGFYLRQDIIWHKPNPMPESVKDRCTKAHEYIFLLTKSARYYFDQEAIAESALDGARRFNGSPAYKAELGGIFAGKDLTPAANRNRRSVWTVATQPYSGAHFATFPPALIEPCILAGCPAGGTVLDPFSGSGTTGQVAMQQGRKYLGIELNPEYQALAVERITPHAAQERLFA